MFKFLTITLLLAELALGTVLLVEKTPSPPPINISVVTVSTSTPAVDDTVPIGTVNFATSRLRPNFEVVATSTVQQGVYPDTDMGAELGTTSLRFREANIGTLHLSGGLGCTGCDSNWFEINSNLTPTSSGVGVMVNASSSFAGDFHVNSNVLNVVGSKVGIGTTTPILELTIGSRLEGTGLVQPAGTYHGMALNNNNGKGQITFFDNSGNECQGGLLEDSGNIYLGTWNCSGNSLIFRTNNTDVGNFSGAGNLTLNNALTVAGLSTFTGGASTTMTTSTKFNIGFGCTGSNALQSSVAGRVNCGAIASGASFDWAQLAAPNTLFLGTTSTRGIALATSTANPLGLFNVDTSGNVSVSGTVTSTGVILAKGGWIANASSSISGTLNTAGIINASNTLLVGNTGFMIPDGGNIAKFVGTMPSTQTGNISGVEFRVTSNGGDNFQQTAFSATLLGGYTGGAFTYAFQGINSAGGNGNINIGFQGFANGNGLFARNAGVVGIVSPGGTTIPIGAYFALEGGAANMGFQSAALIANQAGVSGAPIFIGMSNSTEKVRFDENGLLGLATTTPSQRLSIQGNALTSGTSTIGTVFATGTMRFLTGTSTMRAYVGGTIFDHFASSGNSGTVETDLYTDLISTSTFARNGDKVVGSYGGTFAGSGTASRDLRAYFGGTNIFDTGGLSIAANSSWRMEVTCIRVDSTTARCTSILNTGGASTAVYTNYQQVTLNIANNVILKITGQASGVGAATNDIEATMGYVDYKSSVAQ